MDQHETLLIKPGMSTLVTGMEHVHLCRMAGIAAVAQLKDRPDWCTICSCNKRQHNIIAGFMPANVRLWAMLRRHEVNLMADRHGMSLYIAQVQGIADAKHGSMAALEEARHKRMHDKMQQRAVKRKREQQQQEREQHHLETIQQKQKQHTDRLHKPPDKEVIGERGECFQCYGIAYDGCIISPRIKLCVIHS